jgi:hypothetical protein
VKLATSFFYGSTDSLGILFLEAMGNALSYNGLALACEAVRSLVSILYFTHELASFISP